MKKRYGLHERFWFGHCPTGGVVQAHMNTNDMNGRKLVLRETLPHSPGVHVESRGSGPVYMYTGIQAYKHTEPRMSRIPVILYAGVYRR